MREATGCGGPSPTSKPAPRNTTLFTIQVGEHEVHAQTLGDGNHLPGDQVWLTFKRYHLFEKETGLRLEATTGRLRTPDVGATLAIP